MLEGIRADKRIELADPIFGSGIAVDPEDVSDTLPLVLVVLDTVPLVLVGLHGPGQPGLGSNSGGDVCFQRMNQT